MQWYEVKNSGNNLKFYLLIHLFSNYLEPNTNGLFITEIAS